MAKDRMPDFKEIDRLIVSLRALDERLGQISSDAARREQKVKQLCQSALKDNAAGSLAEIPVGELRNSKAGIRVGALEKAGFSTLLDLYNAPNWKLGNIEGIGDKQVASIRNILNEFLKRLSARSHIRLTTDEGDAKSRALITEMAKYRHCARIAKEAAPIVPELHSFVEETSAAVVIRNRLGWFFSRRQTKEDTVFAVARLLEYVRSLQYERVKNLIGMHDEACGMSEAASLEDFKKNGASYYALIEKLTGTGKERELIYSSIPAQLAEEIDAFDLDTSGFQGDLRAYQGFGARYILTLERVLLGDEMGLGKTIQAIAAMAHLYAKDPDSRFLVVCPASVMVNWCREITKFSAIKSHLLHGALLEDSLDSWIRRGGAAVTNYESLSKIIGAVDGQMKIDMLVIDEAHYIKNPEAKRTKYIHTLEDESERILMMTGTPLENKVDEMCELIGFVRPDLVKEIRSNAGMRHVPEFREILAPVYLRRQRDMVLDELPPLTIEEEWCAMTREDSLAYRAQVEDGNFMGMRRVSFLQEDMETSSKAIRLKELCDLAMEEGRKVIVYSFFRDTISKVIRLLGGTAEGTVAGGTAAGSAAESAAGLAAGSAAGSAAGLAAGSAAGGTVVGSITGSTVVGSITGSTPVEKRQDLIDRFTETPGGAVLVSQVQAGGTGLNIQAAGIVIFCEPQIKPSLEWQALSRVYRMGQVQNVLVYHLLCENTVDEAVRAILARKEEEFDLFAQESVIADAADGLTEKEWIRKLVEDERRKYLPAVVAAEPVANSAAEPADSTEEIAAGEPVDEPEEGAE